MSQDTASGSVEGNWHKVDEESVLEESLVRSGMAGPVSTR